MKWVYNTYNIYKSAAKYIRGSKSFGKSRARVGCATESCPISHLLLLLVSNSPCNICLWPRFVVCLGRVARYILPSHHQPPFTQSYKANPESAPKAAHIGNRATHASDHRAKSVRFTASNDRARETRIYESKK